MTFALGAEGHHGPVGRRDGTIHLAMVKGSARRWPAIKGWLIFGPYPALRHLCSAGGKFWDAS